MIRFLGQVFVYLVSHLQISVGILLLSTFFAGWFAQRFIKGVDVVVAGKIEIHRGGWWRLAVALGLLGLTVGSYPLGLIDLILLWILFTIYFGLMFWVARYVLVISGLIITGFGIVFYLILQDLYPLTYDNHQLVQVAVRSRERYEGVNRVTLFVDDMHDGREETFYMDGDMWGVRVTMIRVMPDIWFLGGRKYALLDSFFGLEDAAYDHRWWNDYFHDFWEVLLEQQASLPGLVFEQKEQVKRPFVSEVYIVGLDQSLDLLVEQISKEDSQNQENIL